MTEFNCVLEINQRVALICLVIIASVMTAGALFWLEPVMVPLVLAIMITYMLAPVVDNLVSKLRFPKWLAVFFALGLTAFAVFMIGSMISNSIKALATKAPTYEVHIRESAESVVAWMEYKGYEVDTDNMEDRLDELPIATMLAGATNTLVDLLSNTFLILVFVIYLLQGRDPETEKVPMAQQIESQIKRYLSIKLVLSLATGFLTALILGALQIELAMVFGVMAFFLNFVPNVGSIVAIFLPLPIILISPDLDMTILALAILLPGSVQMFIGNVIEPKMLGDSLDLHPITVLLSLIFWGMLWGIPGMLLAAPITAVLKILSENLEITAPVARLLSGKLGAKQKAADPSSDSSIEQAVPEQPQQAVPEQAVPEDEVTQG